MGMNKARIGFILGHYRSTVDRHGRYPRTCKKWSDMYGAFFYDRNFWGFQITQPGYTSGLYLLLLAVLGLKNLLSFFDLDWSNDVFDCRRLFDCRCS